MNSFHINGSRTSRTIIIGHRESKRKAILRRWGGKANFYSAGRALEVAGELATFPQRCLRSDRLSAIEQWGLDLGPALANEVRRGMATIRSGETQEGATRFADGEGRHGSFAAFSPDT